MTTPITPSALAVEFSRILPGRIGADGVVTLARHTMPDGGCSACAGADTCDARMALRGAYAALAGVPEPDKDPASMAEVFLDALVLAHSVGFNHRRIPDVIL